MRCSIVGLVAVALSAVAPGQAARDQAAQDQGEAALLAQFDRAHAAFGEVAAAERTAAARRASNAFLRLPFGSARTSRIAKGLAVTLLAGRAQLTLELATSAREGGATVSAAMSVSV